MFLTLSVPFIARLAELSYRGVEEHIMEFAKRLTAKALFIENRFTGNEILKYVRKALRLGVWRSLKPESRALLLALARWRRSIRSPTLYRILIQILLEIELNATRGRAIFYGILIAISRAPHLLTDVVKNLSRLLILGIQYTNLPPVYRVFG